MTRNEWVSWALKNALRVKAYKLGCDGSDGQCDCIGLIIGAWRLSGHQWNGVHGSNWAARHMVNDLEPIASLYKGDLVFKAHNPGDPSYNLPSTYADDDDKRDYYHVGVVTSTEPLVITHCTGVVGGIKKDTNVGQWRYRATLKGVEDVEEYDKMIVTKIPGATGKTVNMRKNPSTLSAVIAQVPFGSEVDFKGAVENAPDWAQIAYRGVDGFMQGKYLSAQNNESECVTVQITKDCAEELFRALKGVLSDA